ncbi:YfgM family protein [Brachymonas denitrificans]|uniref:YfgM family protein n=1 Tax=Brachymonas denitrificans TaxID=28220 RepID=UPI001BCCD503|nr:tetratricopeptide repeat protein [Brachymonas denitrificans]
MAIQIQNLDLEEQEQLDKLKHFWERWGNLISGVLIVALLGFAGWRGYDWYQSRQAGQASGLYDQVQANAEAGDTTKLASSLKAMQDDYKSTTYAQQANLLAAKVFFEKGQLDQARNALSAAAASSTDKGLQSLARLQLASLLTQQKQYDQAVQQLSTDIQPEFAALAADRLGDVQSLQGKNAEAIKSYTTAFKGIEAGQPYRQMIAMKLTALGVDVSTIDPNFGKQDAAEEAAPAEAPASITAPAASAAASSAAAPASAPASAG